MKQEYVFWFLEKVDLEQLNGGHGRDKRIFFSRTDYDVSQERKRYVGTTDAVMEEFK